MLEALPEQRSRVAWWGLTLALGAVLVLVVYSYVGTFVLGLFIYYAARPIHRRIRLVVPGGGLAALAGILVFEVPFLLVTGYVVVLGLREAERFAGVGADLAARLFPVSTVEVEQALADPVGYVLALDAETLGELLRTGASVAGPVLTLLLHLGLAVAIAFYLLRDGERLAGWFRELVGEDSAMWTYARLVDRDLRVVYFGNVRTVVVVAILAMGVYNGLNMIAPAGLRIPVPNLLAVLTGATTLVPVVVSKLVYLPLTAYLSAVAVESHPGDLWFPALIVVVALLVLDLFPIMVVRPLLAGHTTHGGLMMFAYIFGGLLFGWYGIFLGPLLLVATIHLVRVSFSELVHGEEITPEVTAGHSIGAMPRHHGDPPVEDPPDGPPEGADATDE